MEGLNRKPKPAMDFSQRVLCACRHIPLGKVATYGQLAHLSGAPQRPRQAGHALGHGAGEYPAHRVVNREGALSGAGAFLMENLQRSLLEAEGVAFLPDGRVDLQTCRWEPSPREMGDLEAAFQTLGI